MIALSDSRFPVALPAAFAHAPQMPHAYRAAAIFSPLLNTGARRLANRRQGNSVAALFRIGGECT